MAAGRLGRNSLSSRLQYIRKAGRNSRKRSVSREQKSNIPLMDDEVFRKWKKESEFVYSKREEHHFPVSEENLLLVKTSLFLKEQSVRVEDLLFYDLETTGLSTGAGVVAFLAGFGRIKGETLQVKQYFLADFPGEFEFIQAILKEIDQKTVLVSYNGKTFDRHLLKSRALMNGLVFPEKREIDLLHASRRLWKDHLSDCSLSTVERQVLGIIREGDISGKDIPGTYFSYLTLKKGTLLERVFYHHVQDIVSLAFLTVHINSLLRHPAKCYRDDCFSLGKYLLFEGKKEGVSLLEKVWSKAGPFSFKAGMLLSLYYKREGRMRDAVRIWEKMWQENKGYFQGIEMAKFYEHRKKMYQKALAVTDILYTRALTEENEKRKGELSFRRDRLQRKIAKKQL